MNRRTLCLALVGVALLVAAALASAEHAPAAALPSAPGDEKPNTLTNTVVLAGPPPLEFIERGFDPPVTGLPEAERERIRAEIEKNVAMLEAEGRLPHTTGQVKLGWPMRPSRELTDDSYYSDWGFVDHDPNGSGAILDYNCGARTYDGHLGTDYYPWPWPWKKMEENAVEVVAAAPGTIVGKDDGHYDKNCVFEANPWNAVYVRHADGSTIYYGHLKNGSLTSKEVGEGVQAGEYLGIVASSGRSPSPHLHVEIHDSEWNVVDPYTGPCQPAGSWWEAQRPYFDSNVNALTTGFAASEWPECPQPERPNIADGFTPGDKVYFTAYYRDILNTLPSEQTIFRPDGSVFANWVSGISRDFYHSSWLTWSYLIGMQEPRGTWRFEVRFADRTFSTYFNLGDPTFISVTSPDGGEAWAPRSARTITWDDNLGGEVRIELYRNGAYASTIAKSTPSDGNQNWAIPADQPRGDGYRVRIANNANPALYDESDAPFSIGEPLPPLENHVFLPLAFPD